MSYSSRAYLAHCEQQQAEAEGYEARGINPALRHHLEGESWWLYRVQPPDPGSSEAMTEEEWDAIWDGWLLKNGIE